MCDMTCMSEASCKPRTCHTRHPIMPAIILVPKKTRVVCTHNSTVIAERNSNLPKKVTRAGQSAHGTRELRHQEFPDLRNGEKKRKPGSAGSLVLKGA